MDLTSGSIEEIFKALPDEELPNEPIMQILRIRSLCSGSTERYRIVVSDKKHFSADAILATGLNSLVKDSKLGQFAIIKLTKYNKSTHKNKDIIVIIDLEILKPGSEVLDRIGDPRSFPETSPDSSNKENMKEEGLDFDSLSRFQNSPVKHNPDSRIVGLPKEDSRNRKRSIPVDNDMSQNCVPINALNPHMNRWMICARVTSKTNVRTWQNQKGEGKVFNVTLIDQSGEIRASSFNEGIDAFYDLLEVGKVYYVSRATVKYANSKYNNSTCPYEISLNPESCIQLCEGPLSGIPEQQFDFVKLSKISELPKDSMIDILCVIRCANEVSSFLSKSTKKQFSKRIINVVDDSEFEISLTLWNEDSENKTYCTPGVVLAIKNLKVSDFNGVKSLSSTFSSTIISHPNMEDAKSLKRWYVSVGESLEFKKFDNPDFASNSYARRHINYIQSFSDIDHPYTFVAKALLLQFSKDHITYKSCVNEDCRKKVSEVDPGRYQCEKCSITNSEFNLQYVAHAGFCDFSGFEWGTIFHSQMERLLGVPAKETHEFFENDKDKYEELLSSFLYRYYMLTVRIRKVFNDIDVKNVITIVDLSPIDFVVESRYLIEKISEFD